MRGMRKIGQIRQGDVLLEPIHGLVPPTDARRTSEVVLARGKVTGHAHRLQARVILEWETEGQRYVRVAGDVPGTLIHEDHDPVPAPGVAPEVTYRVVPQREWDLRAQWRKVID